MIIGLGFLVLLSTIYFAYVKSVNNDRREKNLKVDKYNEEAKKAREKDPSMAYRIEDKVEADMLPMEIKPWAIAAVGASLIMLGWANPISVNDAGNRQVVQTLGGDLYVKFTPGIYVSGFWSKVTTWNNNFTIQISREENRSEDSDLWKVSDKKDGTFSEGDNAELEHTVKWDLPGNEKQMIDLHITYNNQGNLMSTTLLSFQKKTASFSTQRLSSEAHYSGGKSQLDAYFQDQLRNGLVILETETKTRTLDDGSTAKYIKVSPKLNANGEIIRTKSDIQTFGILSTYTSMDNVHYTPEIDNKLKEKIKYAAEEANSKQELITAQQKEQTAIVQGKTRIAETTATQEALEIEAVIQARKLKLVAAEDLETAKYNAAAELATKTAAAAGDRLKVAAGLSPYEQAEFDRDTAIGVASAIAGPEGIKFPTIVTGGGGSGKGSGALQTLELKMLNDLITDLSKAR